MLATVSLSECLLMFVFQCLYFCYVFDQINAFSSSTQTLSGCESLHNKLHSHLRDLNRFI